MTKKEFENKYQVIMDNQENKNANYWEFFLKDKETGIVTRTDIFASNYQLGEAMTLEKYCDLSFGNEVDKIL